jgi:hypothetical protein
MYARTARYRVRYEHVVDRIIFKQQRQAFKFKPELTTQCIVVIHSPSQPSDTVTVFIDTTEDHRTCGGDWSDVTVTTPPQNISDKWLFAGLS